MTNGTSHSAQFADRIAPRVSLIVAMTSNRVIGRDGDLPWDLPDDMRWFMRQTTGHAIIMGRGNWDAMNRRALPKRKNIVLTRQKDFTAEGATVVHTLDDALAAAGDDDEPFIIGGAKVYELALSAGVVDRLYLTRIHTQLEGDTFFPPIEKENWQEVTRTEHPADKRHAYAFSIITYDRKPD